MYADEPDRYFYPDQYNNPANWLAHYNGTGLEIWQQTMGCVTHFVAGLGTGGTFIGTGRRLRELNPDVRLVAVQPDSARHGLAGLKHMATSIVPGIYDPQLADEITVVETEAAQAMVRRLAREEGLLVGISSGAALVAALRLARELTEGVVVALFPDGGGKYLSESFWENESTQMPAEFPYPPAPEVESFEQYLPSQIAQLTHALEPLPARGPTSVIRSKPTCRIHCLPRPPSYITNSCLFRCLAQAPRP